MSGSGIDEKRNCPHSARKGQGGMVLIMECEDCRTSGLENPACYRGVLEAIRQEGNANSIILRSHIEKGYDAGSVWTMNRLAEILNQIRGLKTQIVADSVRNERCKTCLAPFLNALDLVSGQILGMRLNSLEKSIASIMNYEFRKGVRCDHCEGMARIRLNTISDLAASLESHILSGSYDIKGVED